MKKFKLLLSLLAISLCIGLSVNVNASETTDSESVLTTIQPKALITGEEDTTDFPSYDIVIPASIKSVIVPISMDYKGQLSIAMVGNEVTAGVTIGLYSEEACTNRIGSKYLSSSSLEDTMKVKIPSKGVYYLRFDLSKALESDTSVSIIPKSFSSANKTLKAKKWIGSHSYEYSSQISHKITIDKPGYITVQGASLGSSSIYVTLCNSKKVNLSEQKYISDSNKYTTYYAVKKGTYYINAKSSDDYKLRYTFTAVTDGSGSSQKKATVIGKGKTVKGLILSEDSIDKADWYKVKLTKKQKLSFKVDAKSCDSIKFEIIPESKNMILMGSTFRIYDAGGDTYATEDSMPAGTYYIKVIKTNKTISGYYSIKFNK